jgi:hypothetical protein
VLNLVSWEGGNNGLFFNQEIHTCTQTKLCERVRCKVDKPVFQASEEEEFNIWWRGKLATVVTENQWLLDHWKTYIRVYICIRFHSYYRCTYVYVYRKMYM